MLVSDVVTGGDVSWLWGHHELKLQWQNKKKNLMCLEFLSYHHFHCISQWVQVMISEKSKVYLFNFSWFLCVEVTKIHKLPFAVFLWLQKYQSNLTSQPDVPKLILTKWLFTLLVFQLCFILKLPRCSMHLTSCVGRSHCCGMASGNLAKIHLLGISVKLLELWRTGDTSPPSYTRVSRWWQSCDWTTVANE